MMPSRLTTTRGRIVRLELLHVILPLLLGGLTYLLFRTDSLIMFRWVEGLGLSAPLAAARADLGGLGDSLPDSFLYSFPDAAWLYAFGAQMVILHRDSKLMVRAFWVLLAPLMALGAEFGQALGWVRGTFDVADVILLTVAASGVLCLERWLARGLRSAAPG